MKTVLIFGCSGFVGPYLAKEFLKKDYLVIGVDVILPSYEIDKIVFEKASLLEISSVEKIIDKYKPNYIINLAALSSVAISWNLPKETIDINVNGTLNILETVRKSRLETKILLIGSSEEYTSSEGMLSEHSKVQANNPYGMSKIIQEQLAGFYRYSYGLNIVCTRTFNHTGYGQSTDFVIPNFIKQVADIHKSGKNGKLHVGNLTAKRDFGDVRDMVRAYRMILETNSMELVYNVGSGKCYEIGEILQYIKSLTDLHIDIVVDSNKLRPVDTPVIHCDNSLIRRCIGWSPRYTIFDTIDQMYRGFLEDN